MQKAHRIRLNPTPEQAAQFMRAAGVARFAWNWALDEYKRRKDAGEAVDWNAIKKEFRAQIDAEFPFVREVTKCSPEQAIADLRQSIGTYYKAKPGQPDLKFPGRRRRGKKIGGFGLANDKFTLADQEVRLPKVGWVNMAEPLRFAGKIVNGRVTERGGRWYLTVVVDVAVAHPPPPMPGSVGIDFGLSRFATLSNGEVVETQARLRKMEGKLVRLQRGLCRKKIGSNNRRKWKRKVNRFHDRIACQREDFLHKLTTDLCSRFSILCVEDLCLTGLCRSHLAKSFHDAGIGEAVRQLEYKQAWRGAVLQKVGRFFPSSKRCHVCLRVNGELRLDNRVWTCGGCGTRHDRDLNAAINIEMEGLRLHAGSGYVGVTPVEEVPSTPVTLTDARESCEAGTRWCAHFCIPER